LFEVTELTWQTLAINLIDFLNAYGLRSNIIAYLKDEGSNLNILTSALKSIVEYDFKFGRKFLGKLFWSCSLRSMPYATIDEKVCKNLKYVSIKFA
jgi:hypothetical protein